MESGKQPEGRPTKELLRIVAENQGRLNRIEDVWYELTDAEQMRVIELAESLASSKE